MPLAFLLTLAVLWPVPQEPPQPDRHAALIAGIEQAALSGNREGIRAFGDEMHTLAEFAVALTMPPPARVVIRERDRTTIEGGERMLLEIFWERGIEGRLSTWVVDVADEEGTLRVTRATRLAHVSGLYRLSLNHQRQFDVRNLTLRAPDLELHLDNGSAFVADTPDGVTAVVLLGKGEMRFTPPDTAERTQVRIFSGSEALIAPFDAAFVRVRPQDFDARFPAGSLVERPPSAKDLEKADAVFNQYIGRTLQINLADLSRDRWSITPQAGDLIAEIRTRRHGSLTYTRSTNDAEDVTLFDRRRRRNISVYASKDKLASRGRFYSEDDLIDYDVLAYDLEASMDPDRQRIEGIARLKIRIRAASTATLNLRLAEELNVAGVYSPDFGRLLHLRVVNQHALIVSLPGTMVRGTELSLNISYSGALQPQELDREAIAVQQEQEQIQIPPEPRFLYSNRAYWYPQSAVSDYADVRLSVAVPQDYDVVATGLPLGEPKKIPAEQGQRPRRLFAFESDRPVRYVACVLSRLREATPLQQIGEGPNRAGLQAVANARQTGRARSLAARSADVYRHYLELLGEVPYPRLTLVVTERDVPGGHSPAYFALVDQPLQGSASWRNDPVNFDTYPDFFLAHEIAHQWWGQAIGWKNYHEQWISEGFAQYFATLYAEQRMSPAVASNVRKKMRDTAIDQSSQGPVYLGYRLGHVRGDQRVFRSILYNKSAMVLHMLRLTVGDEAFFKGVRAFFSDWKYRKAGTDDFIAAMEKASGRELDGFFEAWIFGASIPELKFSQRTEGGALVVRLEQRTTPVEVPVMLRLTYASGVTEDVVVVATGPVTEQRVQLRERLRSVKVSQDHTLARFR